MSYMLARMGRCQLYVDYGPNIAMHDVLTPAPDNIQSPLLENWRVPDGFECRKENRCISERFEANFPPDSKFDKVPAMLTHSDLVFGPIPRYRLALQYESGRLWRSDYKQTASVLPGFALESGMACALGSLFQLSHDVTKYDDDGRLITDILPIVRKNPVVTLCIRTATDTEREIADTSVRIALELERKYLAGELELGGYASGVQAKPLPRQEISTFVWLIISDDKGFTEQIVKKYDDDVIGERRLQLQTENGLHVVPYQGPARGKIALMTKQNLRSNPRVVEGHVVEDTQIVQKQVKTDEKNTVADKITRKVITTSAHGLRTKIDSTRDFAEVMIAWYLIGESDAVITSSMHSFGVTAALRTARPIFDPSKYKPGKDLKPEQLIYEGSSTDKDSENSVLIEMKRFCAMHKGYKGGATIQGHIYDLTCSGGKQRQLKSGGQAIWRQR